MKTTILDFSGRIETGNCASIARHIADRLGGEAYTIKVSDAGIAPCGGCRYSCLDPNKLRCDNPDGSLEIYREMFASDEVFYVIPIYSDYPCANYFILRERSQMLYGEGFDYERSPRRHYVFIANTGVENLENIVRSESESESSSDYIVLSTHKYGTKGFYGDLMQNKECVGAVDRYLESCLGDQNSTKAVQQ